MAVNALGFATEEALLEQQKLWKSIAVSVKKADREEAERAVAEIYQACGLSVPREIIWFNSPLQGAIAAALLKEISTEVEEIVRSKTLHFADHRFWEKTKGTSAAKYWEEVHRRLTKSEYSRTYRELGARIQELVSRQIIGGVDEIATTALTEALSIHMRKALDAVYADLDQRLRQVDWNVILRTYDLHPSALPPARSPFTASVARMAWRSLLGNLEAYGLQFFDFAHKSGVKLPMLSGTIELAKHCGLWWAFRDFCVLTERPKVLGLDRDGILHNARGIALQYRDDWGICSWHGTYVPRRFIEALQKHDAQVIIDERNVELKRMMIEAYGYEPFLRDARARIVDQDRFGILFRCEMMHDEPLCMVEVINSTAEPDGTFRKYFLRVPPTFTSARAAVAWTFGMADAEYDPSSQT